MDTTTIYTKPNGKLPIFRCPDADWPAAIEKSRRDLNAPSPMPWDHDMWRNPSKFGYVTTGSTEQDVAQAWEAEARAFLPDGAPDTMVAECAKAMRLGLSPMPFLVHQIMA